MPRNRLHHSSGTLCAVTRDRWSARGRLFGSCHSRTSFKSESRLAQPPGSGSESRKGKKIRSCATPNLSFITCMPKPGLRGRAGRPGGGAARVYIPWSNEDTPSATCKILPSLRARREPQHGQKIESVKATSCWYKVTCRCGREYEGLPWWPRGSGGAANSL